MTNTEFKTRFLPLHKELYRVAVRILGDSCEAEDAVQNLYLHLWERRDTLGSVNNDASHCRQLLKNICIDRRDVQQRREQRQAETPESLPRTSSRAATAHISAEAAWKHIRRNGATDRTDGNEPATDSLATEERIYKQLQTKKRVTHERY